MCVSVPNFTNSCHVSCKAAKSGFSFLAFFVLIIDAYLLLLDLLSSVSCRPSDWLGRMSEMTYFCVEWEVKFN